MKENKKKSNVEFRSGYSCPVDEPSVICPEEELLSDLRTQSQVDFNEQAQEEVQHLEDKLSFNHEQVNKPLKKTEE